MDLGILDCCCCCGILNMFFTAVGEVDAVVDVGDLT
jgi:hypothetical protein